MPIRLHRRNRRRYVFVGLAASLLLLRIGYDILWGPGSDNPRPLHEGPYRVVDVKDAATLVIQPIDAADMRHSLRDTPTRMRLIGLELPGWRNRDVSKNEAAQLEAAKAFTRLFVGNRDIQLRLDRRRIDQDRVPLAYVFVGDRMLNEEILRQGFALRADQPGDSGPLSRRLNDAESHARARNAGLWSQP